MLNQSAEKNRDSGFIKKIFSASLFWFGLAMITLITVFIFLPFNTMTFSVDQVQKIYYVDNMSEAHNVIVQRFNEKYQGKIEVVQVNLPFSTFTTNERKEILARTLRTSSDRIDIFAVDFIWVPRFARWSYDLNAFFSEDTLNYINSEALKACTVNRKLVALPMYIDVGLLYYNRRLLQKLPDFAQIEGKLKQSISWKEFIALGERLKGWENPFYLFAGNSYEGLICSFHEMLTEEQSYKIFNGDSIKLNTPAAKNGLRLLVDLINRYQLTPEIVTSFNEDKIYQYALQTDALFLRGWPGYLKHFTPENSAVYKVKLKDYAIAPLPHLANNEKCAVYGGWNLMISKFSREKDAAVKFITFMLNEKNQMIMHDLSGYVPVNKKTFNNPAFLKRNPNILYERSLYRYGRHRPYREDYTKISDIMSHYVRAALKKEISVEEALIRASQKINSKQIFIK